MDGGLGGLGGGNLGLGLGGGLGPDASEPTGGGMIDDLGGGTPTPTPVTTDTGDL